MTLTIQLALFNPVDVKTWFVQLNAIFAASKVTSQKNEVRVCAGELAKRKSKFNSGLVK